MGLGSPKTWQLVSTVLFVVALAGWAIEGFSFSSAPNWAWIALILSGVTFLVELALRFAENRRV